MLYLKWGTATHLFIKGHCSLPPCHFPPLPPTPPMSVYDDSPEAYERYMATQRRISNWVENTEAHAHQFRRPVPTRTSSSDSIVTLKPTHAPGQMPYGYYRSGPAPAPQPGYYSAPHSQPAPPPPHVYPFQQSAPHHGPPPLDVPYAPVPGPMPALPPPPQLERTSSYPPRSVTADPRTSLQTLHATSPPPPPPIIYSVPIKPSKHHHHSSSTSRRSKSQPQTYLLPTSPTMSPTYGPPPPPGAFRSYTPVSPPPAYSAVPPGSGYYVSSNPAKKSRSSGSSQLRVYVSVIIPSNFPTATSRYCSTFWDAYTDYLIV